MQALGLIETKGLIPAIVSTDVMLKSANVNLLEKTYVGGGLVTILIVGDVGAVKSAIEAGSAEVKRMNEELLISEHVIPRPHDELGETIINSEILIERQNRLEISIEEKNSEIVEESKIDKEEKPSRNIKETEIVEEEKKAEIVEEVKKEKELELKELELIGEEIVELESEKIEVIDERTLKNKADLDGLIAELGVEKASEYFLNVKVKELREIVRKYTNFPMKSKEISKANKKEIVEALKKYYLVN